MRLLDNTRVSFFNAFFVFVVVIYAASASMFVRNYGDIRTIGCWVYVVFMVAFILSNKLRFKRNLIRALLVFFVYALLTTINNGVINAIWINKWLLTLLSAYALCKVFGSRFFVVYESILYYLTVIALICWLFHLLLPGYFIPFARTISFSSALIKSTDLDTTNIIFYTINDEYHLSISTRLFLRNAGFAWEPGAFAVFLCFAIFCNCMRTGFRPNNNIPLLVYLLALMTTQSTTGFITFALMLFVWLIVKKKIGLALIIIPVTIWVNTLPFMGDKIDAQQAAASEFSVLDTDSRYHYNVNRFVAFSLYFDEFLRHPVLGLGGYDDGTWLRRNGYDNIALASGIGQMLAMYGVMMTLLYFLLVFQTIKRLRQEVSVNGILLVFPLAGMLFSYLIWLLPLFITFAFWGYFSDAGERKLLKSM